MDGEKKMREAIEFKKTSDNLCNIFDFVKDVKNERQLLNIIYLAQKKGFIEEIYNDFRFSDIGPFSPRIDFDLELLKMEDMLFESDDPQNTIYLTKKGKNECYGINNLIQEPTKLATLKNLDTEELVDINRYLFLLEKYGFTNDLIIRLKKFYHFSDQRIDRLKQNISTLGL